MDQLLRQIDSGRTEMPRECVSSSISKGSAAWDQSYAWESALRVLRPAMMAVTKCAARICRSGEHQAMASSYASGFLHAASGESAQ